MVNDKVTYAGRVYSLKSAMEWFIYFRSTVNHNIIYGFAENQETQDLNLKKGEEFILTGSEGSMGALIDHVLKELEIEPKYSLKYIGVLGAKLIRFESLKIDSPVENQVKLDDIKLQSENSVSITIKVGQRYKERTKTERIVEVIEIIGDDLDAKANCKLISSILKSHSSPSMTLRTLLSSFDLV
jgi:hypothetical protein